MQKRVLLIDDSVTIKNVFEICLKGFDYALLWASNHNDFSAILDGEKVDIIFIDVNFPREDGYSICEKIRKKLGDTLPIILLVSTFDKYNSERGTISKASGFLIKPFESSELLRILLEFCPIEEKEEKKDEIPEKKEENQIVEIKKSVEEISDTGLIDRLELKSDAVDSTVSDEVTGRKELRFETKEKTEIESKGDLFNDDLNITTEEQKENSFLDSLDEPQRERLDFDTLEDKKTITQDDFFDDISAEPEKKTLDFKEDGEIGKDAHLAKDEMDLWNEEEDDGRKVTFGEPYKDEKTIIEEVKEREESEESFDEIHSEGGGFDDKIPESKVRVKDVINFESLVDREQLSEIIEKSLKLAIRESIDKIIPKLLKEVIEEKIEKLLREKNHSS